MKKDDLLSISPLDGRYSDVCKDIGDVFSEYSLIKYRVYVEIKWFIFLSKIDKIKGLPKLSPKDEKFLLDIYNNFNLRDAKSVKKLESSTKHDVKAIEYFLKLKFDENKNLKRYKEYIHICCTSEDINNLSYALMLKTGKALLLSLIHI